MGGTGVLTAGPSNTASGGGTYRLSTGGSGTWTVTGVQGFVSYGEAIPQGIPGAFGGETEVNVSLDNGTSGVLTITYLLGSPPAGKVEGITVILGSGGQYTKPLAESGDNILAGQRCVANPIARSAHDCLVIPGRRRESNLDWAMVGCSTVRCRARTFHHIIERDLNAHSFASWRSL